MNRIKKNQMLHQFHWELSDEELVYDLMHNFDDDDIRYDRDWGLLIPVVEKIEGMDINGDSVIVEIQQGICEIELYDMKKDGRQMFFEGETKIDSTYKAVVEFVQWYNENKN